MARNRGRWQAQGANIEESEAWNRQDSLTASEGFALLARLEAKLTRAEATHRQACFEAARILVSRAEAVGGIDHRYVRS